MTSEQQYWQQRTREVAAQFGIDPDIAVAQIGAESSFNPRASSGVAHGLAQFTPGTWTSYGRGGDIWNGDDALQAWGRYMSHLLDVFAGDYRLALAGYHSGEGAAAAALRNPAGNPKTNAYVNKIMSQAGDIAGDNPRGPAGDDSMALWIAGAVGVVALIFFLRQ
jgi:soluble lytic murein transglycosylase-like protein